MVADEALLHIERMCDDALELYQQKQNEEVEKLLREVQYDIMKFAVAIELAEEEYYD